MTQANGWIGTILRINLTEGSIKKEPLNMQDAHDYVGARGLGTKYYCNEVDPKVDPLSPENKLIFMTGPLTGTAACSAGRYEVVSKAPLTGIIGAANSGGHFGPELKYAGYDGIIFEGKANHPVYLHINDDQVELLDANELWGQGVHETTEALEAKHGKVRVSCIGTPGERCMLFAAIMNDKNRAAGRGGMGAVMGSKNLKAIAVRGTGGVTVARPEGFMNEVTKARTMLKEHPVTGNGLGTFGTEILVNIVNEVGGLPLRNGRDGSYWEQADDTSGERLNETHLVKNQGCFGCSIACGRVTKIEGKGNLDGFGEGPEYEAGWSYGAACGVNDISSIVKANFICNEQGMDPITLGSTVACAMELYEMGAIPEEDIGFPLRFGDAAAMVKLTQMCADGEGFGKTIGLGSYRLAEKYGHPELSMSVKKQEMPAYDGRAIQGIGLEYATSNRGGCHVRGYMISPEVLGIPVKLDPQVTEGKGAMLKTFQDLTALCDSTGMCLFTTFGIGLPEIAGQYREAVGSDETDEEILLKGERIWNLEKRFNMEAGVEKDTLPPRLLREALPSGPAKGKVNELQTMLADYYEARNWTADGIPTPEKLAELNVTY
ncbi:aldehyde ferredoxin oxidoreductase [Slackia equolifaciens]|uniref:Aldehyde ferredoxin oxidoreductase n=1 Tax=Slackia equolifaciens TaxID=498718 RepID=A0A3N0B118_9ACTN|nr:aldehyde ferredoxin oxidoreductase family protein [Slackia equolifaciens]RNL40821.1 aldehyde ferredoxin oxidoreductase [Slackia equolifaciens]